MSWKLLLLAVCGWLLLIMSGSAVVETGAGNWFQDLWKYMAEQIDFNLLQGEPPRYTMMLDGLGVTLRVAGLAAIIGFLLGIVVAVARIADVHIGNFYPLRLITRVYVDVIRGTPVVVQLFIMYYIIMKNSTKDVVAVLSFGLNSAAYVSEIIRGGILAVDRGQTEAGRSLGLNSFMTLRLIILPQMIRITLPTLLNEIIALLKETSVLGMIGLMDLAKSGDFVRSRTYSPYIPLFTVALVYLLLVTVLSHVFNLIERRLRESDLR